VSSGGERSVLSRACARKAGHGRFPTARRRLRDHRAGDQVYESEMTFENFSKTRKPLSTRKQTSLTVVNFRTPDLDYGAVTGLLSKLTAPLRAKALPSRVAPVWSVMDCSAMTVPLKMEFVPRVAELPVCQKTFLA
jgi:hypothetical protein